MGMLEQNRVRQMRIGCEPDGSTEIHATVAVYVDKAGALLAVKPGSVGVFYRMTAEDPAPQVIADAVDHLKAFVLAEQARVAENARLHEEATARAVAERAARDAAEAATHAAELARIAEDAKAAATGDG